MKEVRGSSPCILETFRRDEYFQQKGFPTQEIRILSDLENMISSSSVFSGKRKTRRGNRYVVTADFNPEYTQKRQDFFRRIWKKDYNISQNLFREIDKIPREKLTYSKLNFDDFVLLAEEAYKITQAIPEELRGLEDVPEIGKLLKRIDKVGVDVRKWEAFSFTLPKTSKYVIDTEKEVIVPLFNDNFTAGDTVSLRYEWGSEYTGPRIENIIEKYMNKLSEETKNMLLEIKKATDKDLIKNFVRHINDEFRLHLNKSGYIKYDYDNIRKGYETVVLPFKMKKTFFKFYKEVEKRNSDIRNYLGGELEEEEERIERRYDFEISEEHLVPGPIFPEFSDHWDIANAIPPQMLGSLRKPYVPIDFKTSPNQNKFLLAGFNSGGKSYFEIALASMQRLSQIGLPILADKAVMPRFNHIYYFNNKDSRMGTGQGRLESELSFLGNFMPKLEEGDLAVIDEVLDSGSGDFRAFAGPRLMEDMRETDATVFVIYHGSTDYDELASKGWDILTPDHRVENGEIKLEHKMKFAKPDVEANRKYAQQLYNKNIRKTGEFVHDSNTELDS